MAVTPAFGEDGDKEDCWGLVATSAAPSLVTLSQDDKADRVGQQIPSPIPSFMWAPAHNCVHIPHTQIRY